MSQMSARFPGRCKACGGYVAVGDRIDWTKGDGARHVQCPTSPRQSVEDLPPRRVRTARRRAVRAVPGEADAPFVRFEKWEACSRASFDARVSSEIGQRVVIADKKNMVLLRRGDDRTSVAADGAAYLVVGAEGRYESAEDNEDMGDCSGAGWQVTLYLRLATEEEAAPARAAAAERAAKVRLVVRRQELERLCKAGWQTSDNNARLPDGEQIDFAPGVHGSGRKVLVRNADQTAVAIWCSGYYDDYRQTLAISQDPVAIEIAAEIFAGAR